MTHQDRISILITFVIGLVAGAYLYVVGFAPTYQLPEAVTFDNYADLVITSDSYGACELENNCMSFQLLADGSYRLLIGNSAAKESYDSKINRSLRNKLAAVLTPEALTKNSSFTTTECRYGADGTNFRFVVARDGRNYILDTCQSQIDYEGEAWAVLTEAWHEVAKAAK